MPAPTIPMDPDIPIDPASPIPGSGQQSMPNLFTPKKKLTILSPMEQVVEKNQRDMNERALSEKAASYGMAEDRYRHFMGLIGRMGLAKDLPEAMQLMETSMTTLQFDWGNQEDLDAFETIIRQAGEFGGAPGFSRAVGLIGEFMDGVRNMGGALSKRAIISVILDVAARRISPGAAADKISSMTQAATWDNSDPWGNLGGDPAKFQQRRDIRQKFENAMQTMFMEPQDAQQQSAVLLSRLMNASSFAQDRLWMAVADAMSLPVANAMDWIRKTYGTLANAVAKDKFIRAALEPVIQTITQMGMIEVPLGKEGYDPFGYDRRTMIPGSAPRAASTRSKLIKLSRTAEKAPKLVRLSQDSGGGPKTPVGGTPDPQRDPNPGTPGGGLDYNASWDADRRNNERMEYARSQEMEMIKADVDARETAVLRQMETIKAKIDLFEKQLQSGGNEGMADTNLIGLINQQYTEMAGQFNALVEIYGNAIALTKSLLQKKQAEYAAGQIPAAVVAQIQAALNFFIQKQQDAVNNRQTMDVESVIKPYQMREKSIGQAFELAKSMGDFRRDMLNVTDYGSAVGLAAAQSQQLFEAADELERSQPSSISSLRAQQLRARALQVLHQGLQLSNRSQTSNMGNAEAMETLGGLPG